jgi:hypothetical protein
MSGRFELLGGVQELAAVKSLVAAAVVAACAGAAAAERVVYCARSAACPPHRTLLALDGSEVAAVADAALAAAPVPLLYLSLDEYREAIAAQPPAAVREIVRQRLEAFSPHALDSALDVLARDARRCAATDAAADRDLAPALELYARIRSVHGFDRFPPAALVQPLVEAENALVAELEEAAAEAQRRGWRDEAKRWSERAAVHRRNAEANAQVLKTLGAPTFAQALPRLELERVAFVQPAAPSLVVGLEHGREPFARWRGGVVAPFGTRQLGTLAREHTVTILYLSRAPFLDDLQVRSAPERERAFARRLREGTSREAYAELLLERALALTVLQIDAARDRRASFAGAVQAQLTAELPWLREALRAVAERGVSPAECRAGLRADADLFLALARRAGNAGLSSALEALSLTP